MTDEQTARERQLLRELNAGDVSAVERLALLCDEAGLDFLASRIRDAACRYKDRPDDLQYVVVRHVFNACPACSSQNTSVKNLNEVWRDGDITCDDCGTYVRDYDAG